MFEGTAALLLSFVFPDLSGNFPDFSRAEPDVSQRGRVELGFVHTWRAKPQGLAASSYYVRGCLVRQDGFKMNKTIQHSFSLLSCLKVQQNVGSFISIQC